MALKLDITENAAAKVNLSEIGHGNFQVEMAFVSEKTHKNISQIVKCKDFFQDIFWSRKKKSSSSIYGFSWSHDKHDDEFSKDWLSVFARVKDNKKSSYLDLNNSQTENLKEFINIFNKSLKFELSETQLDETGKYVLIRFHKNWTEYPYVLSAFFLFARLGLTWDGKKDIMEYITKDSNKFLSVNDPVYVNTAKNKIKDLLDGKIDTNQKYEDYKDISSIHNYSGIVNFKNYKIV
jgi:hypothetical protein